MGVVPASKVSQFPLSTPLPPSAMMTKTNSLPKSMRKQRKQASIFRSLSNKPLSTSPRNRVSSHKLTARCSQVSAPPVYKIGSCRHPATERSVSYPSFPSPYITRNDEIGGTLTLCRVLLSASTYRGACRPKKPGAVQRRLKSTFTVQLIDVSLATSLSGFRVPWQSLTALWSQEISSRFGTPDDIANLQQEGQSNSLLSTLHHARGANDESNFLGHLHSFPAMFIIDEDEEAIPLINAHFSCNVCRNLEFRHNS